MLLERWSPCQREGGRPSQEGRYITIEKCGGLASGGFPQWPERGSELGREELRLLPGREVPAVGQAVVVEELGVGSFRPALWGRVDLVGKGAHGHRYGDALRGEKGQLAFPVQPSRRDRCIGQPVERDVVEDVVSGKALALPGKDSRDPAGRP